MDLGNGLGHLTYSTLVHPGDTWEEMLDEPHHLCAAGEGAGLPERAVRRVPAAVGVLGRDAGRQAPRARQAQALPRRQRHVSLHGQRVPLRAVQGRSVKEQVYEPDWRSEERTQYTINVADILADVVPASIRAVDPDRAARLQAERHRPGRGRELHRACAAGRGAPGRPRAAHRPHRDARRSSPSRSASSRPPTRRSTTSQDHLYTGRGRARAGEARRICRSRRRSSRCAGISASSSTSAIRRWCTRTSPCRCRSSSTPASRSSSCRRPPRCTSRGDAGERRHAHAATPRPSI